MFVAAVRLGGMGVAIGSNIGKELALLSLNNAKILVSQITTNDC